MNSVISTVGQAMKYISFLLALCATTPGFAQDWSGSWGGISLGYGKGTYQQGVSALGEVGVDVDVQGAMLGVSYARNVQAANSVYGFDLGITTGIDGLTAQGTVGPDWRCGTGDCNVSIDALLTVRGRYGMLVAPQMLVYGAAGLAVGRVVGGIENSEQQGSRNTATGYTVGLGVEHMVSDRMTVFGEANFVDLGTLEFGTDGGSEAFDGTGDFSTIRAGVNFRF